MPTPSQRMRRIADLIHQNLALILKKQVSDPRLSDVVLTSVDVAPDLSQAKIYFTLITVEDAQAVTEVLTKASGYLRSLLAQSCKLRYTPRLIFIHDDALVRAERIHQLLEQVDPEMSEKHEE